MSVAELVGCGVIVLPQSVSNNQDWPTISRVMTRMERPVSGWPFIDRDFKRPEIWKDAIARLMTDPDAPLPPV